MWCKCWLWEKEIEEGGGDSSCEMCLFLLVELGFKEDDVDDELLAGVLLRLVLVIEDIVVTFLLSVLTCVLDDLELFEWVICCEWLDVEDSDSDEFFLFNLFAKIW